MKKISLIVIVSLLLAYIAGWFIAARIAKSKILGTLEDLKAQQVISNYSTTIKIKGFPFHFDIALESPNVQINTANPKGEYNLLYDGTVRLRVGLFSSSIKLITNGDLHLQGTLRGTLPGYKFDLVATGEDTNYKVKLTDFLISPELIKQLLRIKESPSSFIDVIESVSIQGKNIKVTNKLTNNYLFMADKVDIRSFVKSNQNLLKVDYKEELVNAQFSNESLNVWRGLNTLPALHELVAQINPKVVSYFEVFTLPKFGQMNHSIALTVDKDSHNCDIDIDTFNIKDALEDISASGTIHISPTRYKLDVSSDKKFTPAYYDLIQVYMKNIGNTGGVAHALGGLDQGLGQMFGTAFGSQSTNYSLANELKKFGEIKTNINVDYKKLTSDDYDLVVSKFKVKTDVASISTKGQLQHRNLSSTYNFKVDANNYEYITDAALDYIDGNHLNKTVFVILNVKMTEPVRRDIKNFIREVSDDPDSKSNDVTLNIVNSDGGKYPAVGRYSSREFENRVQDLAANIATREVKQKVQGVKDVAQAISNLSKDPNNAISDLVGGLFK